MLPPLPPLNEFALVEPPAAVICGLVILAYIEPPMLIVPPVPPAPVDTAGADVFIMVDADTAEKNVSPPMSIVPPVPFNTHCESIAPPDPNIRQFPPMDKLPPDMFVVADAYGLSDTVPILASPHTVMFPGVMSDVG